MPDNDVALVRWPHESERLDELRATGAPRLLLVEGGVNPPVVEGGAEDWIRLPADEADLRARVQGIERRAQEGRAAPPEIDDDGVIRVGEEWVSLPPVEARLTSALVERYRAVVSREALARAGWPEGAPGRNALDVHVLRLRRRLAPLGLTISTVRSRGYLLERR